MIEASIEEGLITEDMIPFITEEYEKNKGKILKTLFSELNLSVYMSYCFNGNGDLTILPLNLDGVKTIGVIGPNANNRRALKGNYEGTASRYVTVLEGIQDYVGDDVRVLYSLGSHLFKDKEEPLAKDDDRIAEAVMVSKRSDLVVLVVGLDETLEGEEGDTGNSYASGDKNDLMLPKCQQRLLDAVLAVGKPVIVCMMAGSAIDMSTIADKADALLMCWYPGAQGGKTVADILFGKVSPSGKLPLTFYKNEDLEKMPTFEDYAASYKPALVFQSGAKTLAFEVSDYKNIDLVIIILMIIRSFFMPGRIT